VRGVDCRFGEPVVKIDREDRVVPSNEGGVPHDSLVIATGSAPFIIPVPAGVVTDRDLGDTNAMIAASAPGAKAVVIGGGLPGLEAAAGIAARGAEVTVIHLMGRQLDPAARCRVRPFNSLGCIAGRSGLEPCQSWQRRGRMRWKISIGGSDEITRGQHFESAIEKSLEELATGSPGLLIENGKAIMASLQRHIVEQQCALYALFRGHCQGFGGTRPIRAMTERW